MTPSWLLGIFAALMLAVAAVSLARLAAARSRAKLPARADIDAAHLLMGIAMAGMLASGLRTFPNAVWDVIFTVLAVWFATRYVTELRGRGGQAQRNTHYLPHLVHSAAMLYMFLAVTTPVPAMSGSMGGMATGAAAMSTLRLPTLAFIFAVLLSGFAITDLDQVSTTLTRTSRRAQPASQPALATAAISSVAAAQPAPAQAVNTARDPDPSDSTHSLIPAPPSTALTRPATGVLLSDRTAMTCRVCMGITMALMLIIMI
jgi:uncharacterized protein DUF5134